MENKMIGQWHKPYVRGPHFRYFLIALLIAFGLTILLSAGLFLLIGSFASALGYK